jgi:YVTN family beta-propeller protein
MRPAYVPYRRESVCHSKIVHIPRPISQFLRWYNSCFMLHLRRVLIGSLIGFTALATTSYKVQKSIAVPGEGSWDYLTADSQNRRLYVSHATKVDVVNLDTGAVIGRIPNTNGVHGIAIADNLHRGFISDGRDNQVTIFNLKTLAVISTVKAGTNPDAILYDPFSQRVFAFNGRSNDVTAINGATGKVAGTVPLGGKPEFAVTDAQGNIYVNIEDKSELVHLDPNTLTIKDRWQLAPCDSPSGLAIDPKNQRLFPVCDNKIMAVVDAGSGKVITTVPIGEGPDAAAFDPEKKLVFSSNGEGTLTVVQQETPNTYTVAQTVNTQRGARTMTIDLKTHKVYLSVAEFGPTPAASTDNPRPRPKALPSSFKLLVVSEK